MHELAIVEDLMNTVQDSALENNLKIVKKVKIVVGKNTSALADSLLFCFEALSPGTIMEGASLEITETPGRELYVDYYDGE